MPNDPAGIVPFRQFVDSLQQVKPSQHLGMAESQALHEDAVQEMNNHLVRHYQGIEAVHSFVDENGSVFDCVPIEQQPALKQGAAPATPPDLPTSDAEPRAAQGLAEASGRAAEHIMQLAPNRKDQHGNIMHAPDGTIPMRRLTMQNLRRFQTLRQFFQKSPYGSGKPPRPGDITPSSQQGGGGTAAVAVAATHRWAHAFQTVDNHGGHSFLNVWDPPIGANQVFSLSQHWYTAGSGANLQTAEVGWQVYPQMYGNTKPVFFIYWTADDYKSLGCYNLTCPAFVQTNNKWAIGGAISPWSTVGGAQKEIEVSFFLTQGRWWLYVGGGAAVNAIGYYPVSLYRNGAMATQATGIDYGGETVGTTSWPPMGSGAFANQGWQHAAYQRDIRYYPSAGGNLVASLNPAQASPQCYTVAVSKLNPSWNETIFFGGPGGNNC
jgi:Neprosin